MLIPALQEIQVDTPCYKEDSLPLTVVGIFIEQPTPFLDQFFKRLQLLRYPKKKIHLFIHNHEEHHLPQVSSFVEKHGQEYRSLKVMGPEDHLENAEARRLCMNLCKQNPACEYYFSLDAEVVLKNPDTLQVLMEQNK
ncbi:procollagen-lysine,2-oxoglutarate 5-dioxygenase 1-like [Notechis scutatus]|uniref:Procollagen-lysine,2-oxoglutarate 5-dioxygenase 1-like n=1 Tax=Notechis scutatus TaxID=8663 RepID=A0A6J1W463_9SAUR|nr:procollagen-lysine,2-oxoglutarate 5-dioxygenase 1-like [Notechis scutatus]